MFFSIQQNDILFWGFLFMNFSEIKILFLIGIRLNQNLVWNYRLYKIIELYFLHQIPLRTVKFQIFGAKKKTFFPPSMSFKAGFQGKELPKTIKNMPNFPFKNNKMLNNSFFPPWVDLKTHIPGIVMSLRFFWHRSLEWSLKFLLWSFMDGVIWLHIMFTWE